MNIAPCSPLRLLFSARDPAAGHAIRNLAEKAFFDSRFQVKIVSSLPATDLFLGLPCEHTALSEIVSSNKEQLTAAAKAVLDHFKPHAVVVGASGPDTGIDEVLLSLADNVRRYVVQDFWGDVNLTLNAPPDCYFVVDRFAAELTKQRVERETYIVGSVKHAGYGTLDLTAMRGRRREALGIVGDRAVIGYFGMPLGFIDGYWRTLKTMAEALLDLPVTLVYRPHPKEEGHMKDRTSRILSEVDSFILDYGFTVEETLAGCDLVLSCYSSCGVDSELLGRNYPQDDRLSVFLLFDKEVFEHYQSSTELNDVPISQQKRSITIKDPSELKKALESYLSSEQRLNFLDAGAALPTSNEGVKKLLDKVYDDSFC